MATEINAITITPCVNKEVLGGKKVPVITKEIEIASIKANKSLIVVWFFDEDKKNIIAINIEKKRRGFIQDLLVKFLLVEKKLNQDHLDFYLNT